MEPAEHLAFARSAGERIRAVARGDLTVAVPSCPDYDLRRLVVHCGYFCRFVTRAIAGGSRPDFSEPEHRDREPIEWFDTGFEPLLATLSGLDPATPVWTWGRDGTAGFWFRRAAQELAVHAWDAENALGEPAPIDPAVGADGIDELLDEFAPARGLAEQFGGAGQTIHLHATDVEGGEWQITAHPDRFVVERQHAKGDVAARGSASDLFLFLWGRVPASRLETFGDTGLLDRWQESVRI
ncbi:MAG TPA: maleylpyruvate isomerase family mycothiol-dependent enzyme [Acidimicrobiia bacterium]|nr:maleylpyruvate isomerase family mycothiol-dependent enzyme [Acidimicrobiia bacterium]